MQSFDFIVNGMEIPIALEQLFVASVSTSNRQTWIRAPLMTLTTATVIETMGKAVSAAPTLVYVALPDGLYVGTGCVYRAGLPITDNNELAWRWGQKVISEQLWRWRELSGHWDSITLTSAKLKKRPCRRFNASLSCFPTPEIVFTKLMQIQPDLALPGTAVICATPFIGLPVHNQDRFELTLTDTVQQKQLVHRYEIYQMD